MIVSEDGPSLVLITQADHANLASELLELWRLEELPQHPRRSELLFAAREHDCGWHRPDAVPLVSPESGLPVPYDRMPQSQRLDIWKRASFRHVEEHPWASRLIIRHAQEVNRDAFEDRAWEEFRERLRQADLELAERAGASAGELDADYRWLALADLLSLGACGAFSGPRAAELDRSGYRLALELGRLALAPFPLAGSTTLEVPCRRLSTRRFSGSPDLAGELAASTWQHLQVRVEPLAPEKRSTGS